MMSNIADKITPVWQNVDENIDGRLSWQRFYDCMPLRKLILFLILNCFCFNVFQE